MPLAPPVMRLYGAWSSFRSGAGTINENVRIAASGGQAAFAVAAAGTGRAGHAGVRTHRPRQFTVAEVEPPPPHPARSWWTLNAPGCAGPTSSFHRPHGDPAFKATLRTLFGSATSGAVPCRRSGRGGSGVGRPAGHRRHHARLRPLSPLPHRAAARLRGTLRDRRPGRLARRPGGAGAGAGRGTALRVLPDSVGATAGATVEPGRQCPAGRPGRRPGAGRYPPGPGRGHDSPCSWRSSRWPTGPWSMSWA